MKIMVQLQLKLFTWVCIWVTISLVLDSSSWCPQQLSQKTTQTFQRRTERFWEYDKMSSSWVEVGLPYDLVSCVNENCTKVALIDQTGKSKEGKKKPESKPEGSDEVLHIRKRVSLTRMSESSIWVTGESGSVYERFWNGVQWVIAPHDLPVSAGPAVSTFVINHTILALSEEGKLYQLQLSENSQLSWTDFATSYEPNKESDIRSPFQVKTGVVSDDGGQAYFSTTNGSLVEYTETESQRWTYHGHPPGADVVAITNAASIRPGLIFTVSSSGKLYEFDRSSKPSWKRHTQSKGSPKDTLLSPTAGCTIFGLAGAHSISLFLLTKTGNLIERRLHQRKWRWIVHGSPKKHHLASIMSVEQDELTDKIVSFFFTTTKGFVFEYRLPKHSGLAQDKQVQETWVNHRHPLHAKAARGVPGLQIQIGRILFALDDGRLAELHFSGTGGDLSAPTQPISSRRKGALKYEWSIIDAPESEGWNAECCTEERGPLNCITGMRDEANGLSTIRTNRRKGGQAHESYLTPSELHTSPDQPWDRNTLTNGFDSNFRMRVMQEGRSYFFVTNNGSVLEYLYTEHVWLWLMHEHSIKMKGILGNYNGSLFLVDAHGSLVIRERNENELAWINGTALRKGKQVASGPPWDRIPGKTRKVTEEDALFFVSKTGRLLQFRVALRKYKWKDCRKPANTKIAYIVDQEVFRDNIVFTVGRNGRLYQYNKVTELWHEHLQSPHLILARVPGTAMRQSSRLLTGSIFMVAEDGGLVEYQWRNLDAWNWVEHGTSHKGVTFGAPGPCVEYNQLFLTGSDGEVYVRYMDQRTWKWKSYGFPSVKDMASKDKTADESEDGNKRSCDSEETLNSFETGARYLNDQSTHCDSKVASVRPIPFAEDVLIFELRDGRLAELRKTDETQWEWSRIIGTPSTLCLAIHWTTPTL